MSKRTKRTKLNETIKNFSTLPFFIDDTPDPTIQDIKMKIKKVIFEQNQIGLVIIDYLQLMQNIQSKNENRVQELSQITRSLKNLANDFDIPVIALSQLSRSVEVRTDKKPILSDLRESGSIEQDADLVLMLYQNENNLSNNISSDCIKLINLIIAKQRNGPTGSIKIKFDQIRTKYFDI